MPPGTAPHDDEDTHSKKYPHIHTGAFLLWPINPLLLTVI